MKHTLFKFLGVSLLFGLLALTSCTKDNGLVTEDAEPAGTAVEFREGRSFDLPQVVDDRFSFRDFEHLTAYYQALDEIYEIDDQQFNATVGEHQRGVRTVHARIMSDEFAHPEERYQPFLSDPIMMSIVNEHFELEVENVLITYMNDSDLLISDPNDRETQTAIREMDKGQALDFDAIPERAYWGEDTNERSLKPWCGCDIKIEQVGCNEVRVFGTCKNFIFGDGGGTVRIYLTNSPFFPSTNVTPNQVHTTNGNFSFTVSLNNLNSIFIHASANPDCFFNNTVTTTLEFDPNGSSCDFSDANTGWLWAQDNGSQGMSHRTAHYKNFWSSYAEAKIYSYWYNGSRWVRNNQELEVTIDETRKNDVCFAWEQEDETKTCNSCSNKRARVNSGIFGEARFVHHCDGDVTGTFKKTLNWNGMTWSINAVGEVDFECCE